MSTVKEVLYVESRSKLLMDIYLTANSSGLTINELRDFIDDCYQKKLKLLNKTPLGALVRKAIIMRISKQAILAAVSTKPRDPKSQTVHKVNAGTMADHGLPSTISKLDPRTKMRRLKGRQFVSFVQGGAVSPK